MSNHNHTRADLAAALAAVDADRHNAGSTPKPIPGYGRYTHAAERFEYLEAHLAWFKAKAELLADENRRLRERLAEIEAGRYV